MQKHNSIGENVTIREGTVIGENVTIEDGVYIDYNCIIRDNVTIKKGTVVGAQCILGEFQMDFYRDGGRDEHLYHPVVIGEGSIIRSGTIIYGDVRSGRHFQTGHRATIRERTTIGDCVSIGTLSDVQGRCTIGNHVRIHSNVFLAEKTVIDDCVWIFPHVIFTNDPIPPSDALAGAKVESFAIISAGSMILPGVNVGRDSLVAAGAVVSKDVPEMTVVAGVPAKPIKNVTQIKNPVDRSPAYPWKLRFSREMPWDGCGYEEWLKRRER